MIDHIRRFIDWWNGAFIRQRKIDIRRNALRLLTPYALCGLFFRESESLPFGSAIRPVRELLEYLVTGRKAALVA